MWIGTLLHRALLGLSLACLATSSVGAAPTDPVSVQPAPEGVGAAFVPGVRLVADLAEEYVEQEFLVGGNADLFSYANDPPAGPTDLVMVASDVAWKTRLIVRRPANAERFNGSVVIEWWNSTAGFDSAPAWDVSAAYFAREGFIYIGVTNSTNALNFLRGGCRLFNLLPPTCGSRYASLVFSDNGLAYEALNQISNLLKNNAPESPIPAEYHVRRLYHVGQSQQAGSLITYASAFHQPSVEDGYFIQANIFARRIKDGPVCGASGAPAFPGCVPTLQGDDVYVRSDLPVPVVQALTETDVAELWGIGGRQPDTHTFRYYEVAGSAHLTVHKNVEVIPAGLLGPNALFLEDACVNPLNTGADGPVFVSYPYNAMWRNLEWQVRFGRSPPAGREIETDPSGEIVRDEFGNAKGGVRQPAMDVPIASYNPPVNDADPGLPLFLRPLLALACRLGGSVEPFDQATLDALYPNHGRYVSRVVHSASHTLFQRFLLREDWVTIVDEASGSMIGMRCGHGFEAALVLPPILWLDRRRRRRARPAPHG